MIHKELYKIDNKGKTRVWYMESDGDKHRTISGIKDGKLVTSGWTITQPTNVGRANARTAEEQTLFEVEAEYKKQLAQGGYSEDLNNMGSKFFEPMLAKKYEDFVKKPVWPVYSQPKLDGVRCIINKDGMWSREGKPFVSAPHIFKELEKTFEKMPHLVLDGELYTHKLRDDFNKIISLVKKQKPTEEDLEESKNNVEYHVYDIYDGTKNLFSQRFYKIFLEYTLGIQFGWFKFDSIKLVTTIKCHDQETLDELYREHMSDGYEGQMIRIDGPYENKRSKYLLKRKEFQDEEFEVVSLSEGLGNWSGACKSIRCRKKDGTEFDSGVRGTYEFAKELLTRPIKYVTIRYQNLTPDGIPRFPVAVQFWENERDM